MRKVFLTCPLTGTRVAMTEGTYPGVPVVDTDQEPDAPLGFGTLQLSVVIANPQRSATEAMREGAREEFETQIAAAVSAGEQDSARAALVRAQFESQLDATMPAGPELVVVSWVWEDISPEGVQMIVNALLTAKVPFQTVEQAMQQASSVQGELAAEPPTA